MIILVVAMILNKQQKESMIIELLEEGHSVQQIAKQAYASFTTIKEIRDKITGRVGRR
jgi:DNA-binding NarL/FixJ family response regulator